MSLSGKLRDAEKNRNKEKNSKRDFQTGDPLKLIFC